MTSVCASALQSPRAAARAWGLALIVLLVATTAWSTAVARAEPEGPTVAADGPVAASGTRGGAVPPVPGEVRRGFEPPAHPYGPGHRGVALAADPGDPVVAALGGTVTWAGPVAGTGWVTVDHGGGLDTTYGPLMPIEVTAGTRVARGATLGALAPEARDLHWGARRDGTYLDPLGLLGRWRPRLVPTSRRSTADAGRPGAIAAAPRVGARPVARAGGWALPTGERAGRAVAGTVSTR